MNNFQILSNEIIGRSSASSWEDAKKEWQVVNMEEVEETETCLCGHPYIKEVFTLRNMMNGSEVRVGSSCVNNFIQKNDSFRGYRRIKKDPINSATLQLIQFAHKADWITASDYMFYLYIRNKRKSSLSSKQRESKQIINAKIISRIKEGHIVSGER